MGDLDDRLASLIDEPVAHLDDPDPAIRRLAVSACAPLLARPEVPARLAGMLLGDEDPAVRAECAEVIGLAGASQIDTLLAATSDPEPTVLEAVATSLGAAGSPGAAGRNPTAISWLLATAEGHEDRLVREAAVAALGEIGDPEAIDLLLRLVERAPPQVRRRAVVALTVFEDDRIEPAIRRAAHDRNPMVREAAEMIVGPQRRS